MTNKQTGIAYFIIAIVFAIIILFSVFSCNNDTGKTIASPPKESVARIFAVYIKRDGNKQADIVLRQVYKNIKYDSVAKKDVIVYDTAYGYPVIIKQVDSVGNILKTVDGKDSINVNPVYIPIGRDSVNWRVQGISLDSLLRK